MFISNKKIVFRTKGNFAKVKNTRFIIHKRAMLLIMKEEKTDTSWFYYLNLIYEICYLRQGDPVF
jgi:hypothetical protein